MKSGVMAAVLASLTLGASACSDEKLVAPTPGIQNQQVAVESFTGTLPKLGFRFYSFTVPKSGPISIVLLSLAEGGTASTATVSIGLGVPRGTDCLATNNITIGVGVGPQLSVQVDPLVYCARISDVGNLTATSADFAMNIVRPK